MNGSRVTAKIAGIERRRRRRSVRLHDEQHRKERRGVPLSPVLTMSCLAEVAHDGETFPKSCRTGSAPGGFPHRGR